MAPGPAFGDLQPNGVSKNVQFPSSPPKPVSPSHSSYSDPMDVTPTAPNSMGPPVDSSPEVDPHSVIPNGNSSEHSIASGNTQVNSLTAAAATSAAQPKMVNTAFIHKLYKYEKA